jgi:hypothetical protein
MASISRCFCSTSKKPPQVGGAFLDVVEAGENFRCDHGEGAQGAIKKERADIKDRLGEVRPEF